MTYLLFFVSGLNLMFVLVDYNQGDVDGGTLFNCFIGSFTLCQAIYHASFVEK